MSNDEMDKKAVKGGYFEYNPDGEPLPEPPPELAAMLEKLRQRDNDPNRIGRVDLTWKDLGNLLDSGKADFFFALLHILWIGKHKDREHDVRVGSMEFYFDEEDHLHMDFSTRFNMTSHKTEVIEAYKEMLEEQRQQGWVRQK